MTDLSRFRTKAFRHGREIEIEVTQSATKPKNLFARVPLRPAAKAAKVTRNEQLFVWIWLQHLAWKAEKRGHQTFAVTNTGLTQYSIDRDTKWKALRAFEAAGLISIVRHKNKSPVVALTNHIE